MARRVQKAEGAMTVEWPSLSRDQHGYEEFMSGMTINLIIQLFVGAIGDNVSWRDFRTLPSSRSCNLSYAATGPCYPGSTQTKWI
jgi:hypothetical protein